MYYLKWFKKSVQSKIYYKCYSFKLIDGTIFDKRGELRNPGTSAEELVISGFYYFLSPNGVPQLTEYYADKFGDHKKTSSGPGAALPPRVVATMIGLEEKTPQPDDILWEKEIKK